MKHLALSALLIFSLPLLSACDSGEGSSDSIDGVYFEADDDAEVAGFYLVIDGTALRRYDRNGDPADFCWEYDVYAIENVGNNIWREVGDEFSFEVRDGGLYPIDPGVDVFDPEDLHARSSLSESDLLDLATLCP